jgi:hypothetical protein
MTSSRNLARSVVLIVALAVAAPAAAIPAFARKYATSCLTCHTVYPKLTPFGEAFRRNNFRFPGVDSDYIKAEQIPLGQEANKKAFPNAVYPASIPAAVPLSIGANGQAFLIPSKTSTAGRSLNGGSAGFTAQDLVAEAHLWAGAAIDDTITYWAELTLSSDGVDVEHAQVYFNDLLGPKHAVNLAVGHAFPTLTQFGPHSSYLADAYFTTVPVAGIYQTSSDPFTIADNYTGLEVNGVIEGRLEYSVGLNAGKTLGQTVTTDNFYGHVGYKIGGMRLDGEGSTGAQDPLHPWAEDALGVYAFGYQANSRLDTSPAGATNDVSNVFGLGLRGQHGSTELNVGWYNDAHNHGTDAGTKVTAQVLFAELSHVVYPWMVPAIRVERVSLKPSGSASVSDTHIMPGVAFAIRPNLKLVAVMNIEMADGFPSTGAWQGGSDWGPLLIAAPPSGKTKVTELESFGFFFAWAM